MIPPSGHGVRLLSMGFFVPEDQAVIWRGPMLHKALEQFLTDVAWGEPDYLVIDMPPGTGDVSLSMAQFLPARRGRDRDHAAARRAGGRAARRGDGREGGARRHRRRREHELVPRRRRHGATRSSAPAAARSSPTQLGVPLLGRVPAGDRAARGWRHRHADRRERPGVGGGPRRSSRSPSRSTRSRREDLPLRALDQLTLDPDRRTTRPGSAVARHPLASLGDSRSSTDRGASCGDWGSRRSSSP